MTAKRYEQVAERVRALADAGPLRDGDRIPSVRSMARQMRVSVTTVLEGYRLLEQRGFVESRPQSGFFLRPRSLRHVGTTARAQPAAAVTEGQPIELLTDRVQVNAGADALLRDAGRRDVLPLGAGLPAAEFFPSAELAACMRRVLRRDPLAVNQYCLPPGHARLRAAVARHLLDAGCTCESDEIYITAGASHALLLGLRAVAQPGDTVAVESPGYFGFFGILQFLGLQALELPSDPVCGLSVDALGRALQDGAKISCVLLSPHFANPTGALMPEDQKRQLVALCARHRVPILEDDTYGDLAFTEPRPRPLKAFAPSSVMHAGSFSKILAPGYRVGWLAAGRHRRDVGRCNLLSFFSVGLPTQLGMAEFLSEGGMSRHLRRLRGRYRDSVTLVQNAVATHFPAGTQVTQPLGGHYLWVRLPAGRDSRRLATLAMENKLSIAPGVLFSSRGHYADYLRLNCAIPWSRRVQAGLETLGELAKALPVHRVGDPKQRGEAR